MRPKAWLGGNQEGMAEIVPRWEWRAFARGVPRADAAFNVMAPASVEESDELYLSQRLAGTTSRSGTD